MFSILLVHGWPYEIIRPPDNEIERHRKEVPKHHLRQNDASKLGACSLVSGHWIKPGGVRGAVVAANAGG